MQNKFFLTKTPHRRYNPLKDEWILVSPQRTKRPWQGKQEIISPEKLPIHDPDCYLCPGNLRADESKNPVYSSTYVFENDFPAIIKSGEEKIVKESALFCKETVTGVCKVVCFSPEHNLTLAQMPVYQIENVIKTWIKEVISLKKYKWVQVFENKGSLMGCSNPHPHGQIWASNFIPNEIYKEDIQQEKYFKSKHSQLLYDYLQVELLKQERVIIENNSFAIMTPFWAVWPYETILIAKNHHSYFTELDPSEVKDLSKIMKKLLTVYDKLFDISMPYSMGWHFAPNNFKNNYHWQLHAHYYPPLLRSATVKKFMVGYEMLAEAQRDITPEQATEKLKSLI